MLDWHALKLIYTSLFLYDLFLLAFLFPPTTNSRLGPDVRAKSIPTRRNSSDSIERQLGKERGSLKSRYSRLDWRKLHSRSSRSWGRTRPPSRPVYSSNTPNRTNPRRILWTSRASLASRTSLCLVSRARCICNTRIIYWLSLNLLMILFSFQINCLRNGTHL